jgi:exopolysaccharide biosynthesis predicted pyruvyltransferase EpsI
MQFSNVNKETMKKVLLINDTSNEAHIGSRSVVNLIRNLCELHGMFLQDTLNRLQMQEYEPKVLSEMIGRNDIILINGEGSLHHHPRIATQFFPLIMRIIPQNKKIALINALWQKMDYKDIKQHIRKIDIISFRESLSYDDFHKNFKHKNTRVVPDLIFYNNFNDINKIGYSDSVNKKIRDTFKRQGNYMPLNFIDSGTYLHPTQLTYPSLQAYILWVKSLDLLITGRFHGVCLSVLANTPFLAYESNSHKIRGLLKDLGCQKCLISKREHEESHAQIAKKICTKSQKYVEQARSKIDKLFEDISKL